MTLAMNVESARRQMIEQQVRAWTVLDERVLETLGRVRRELFVPAAYRELAFADTQIPLGHGQNLLAPRVEGRILQALAVQPGDEVLEIGTGSGFFAACLALLAGQVRSIEIIPELALQAQQNLRAAGISGVSIETGDALALSTLTREPLAGYDAIAVTGSLPIYDARFERALTVGGRALVIVGQAPVMEARLITRVGEQEWTREALFETVVTPLLNAPQPPSFVF
jgi:protein-L-isoaspartate(D-aspartate) O-methyltransferase